METNIQQCPSHGMTLHSKYNKTRFKCNKCNVEAVHKMRKKLKQLAVEYKGGCCKLCGYNKCIEALQFHHIDPTTKSFGISAKGTTRSFEKLKVELDKCDLLCSNCHAELHTK